MSKKRRRRKKVARPVTPVNERGGEGKDATVATMGDPGEVASEAEAVIEAGSESVTEAMDATGDGGTSEEDATGDAAGGAPDVTDTFLRKLWKSPVYNMFMYVYELAAYSVGGGLCVAMVAARCGANGAVQWVLGVTVILAVVLSKTVFAGDLGSIYDEALEKVEEDRRREQEELANGDFEGVPKVVRDLLPYPTEEDYQRVYREAGRQRGLLRDWEGRGNEDGDDDGDPE